MTDLLADGLDAFIGFQDDLARLQAEIQRDIGELKKSVRKNKQAIPALEYLRRLRWFARCIGDALAWEVLLFDRKAIAALMSGAKPPIVEITPNHQAVVVMAGHLLGQQFGVPIIHDITNWLRIGDITFMQPNGEGSWRFQTVELKSSVNDSGALDDGVVNATMTVNVYSNESLDRLKSVAVGSSPNVDAQIAPTASSSYRQDRRLERQIKRLDEMVARRDAEENAIVTIDDIPNVALRLTHGDTHYWRDFRRAIRNARRDGFSFFSIDGFIGYGLFYRREGVTEEHIASFQEPYVQQVQSDLIPTAEDANRFLLVREVPMREEYDIEGFPIMRFFSYKIPRVAINDLLRHRLMVTAVVNMGRLDHALVDQGFTVVGINATSEDQPLPYSVDVSWPNGERFRVGIPMSQVSREVERALYEFSGLDDVIQKVASVKLLPEVISYEDWNASLEAQASESGQPNRRRRSKRVRPS